MIMNCAIELKLEAGGVEPLNSHQPDNATSIALQTFTLEKSLEVYGWNLLQ